VSLRIRDQDSWFERPLRRSREDRVVAGVCGGVAQWLGWDPTVVRILVAGTTLVAGFIPGVLLYVVGVVLIPERRRNYRDWLEDY